MKKHVILGIAAFILIAFLGICRLFKRSAGIWVKPKTKTTYIVRQQLWCSGVKWDTVTVHVNTVGLSEEDLIARSLTIYPNPFSSYLNIDLSKTPEVNDYSLLDISGRRFLNGTITDEKLVSIETKSVHPGLYFLILIDRAGNVCHTKKVIKY